MFFDTFKLELGVSYTSTKQTHFHRRFQIISLNIAKSIHNYPTRNAHDYSIYKAKKMIFRIEQYEKSGILYGILWIQN